MNASKIVLKIFGQNFGYRKVVIKREIQMDRGENVVSEIIGCMSSRLKSIKISLYN
jgi:hypothetical protein